MFATRQAMLGFACALFWAITGAQAYTLSTIPWGDVYYYIAFSCLLGMTTFTALAAYGLREKRDTLADESMDEEESIESMPVDEEKEAYDELFSMGSNDGDKDKETKSKEFRERIRNQARENRDYRLAAKQERRKMLALRMKKEGK
jgi:hypothetical protein